MCLETEKEGLCRLDLSLGISSAGVHSSLSVTSISASWTTSSLFHVIPIMEFTSGASLLSKELRAKSNSFLN